jgi:hypothetical protein
MAVFGYTLTGFGLIVGVLFVVGQLKSHGAGTPIAFEAEAGSLASGAVTKTDSLASGATSVQFGAAALGLRYGPYGSYKPSALTTGVPSGTILTQYTNQYGIISDGFLTITTPGLVIDSYDIPAFINIEAANVTIKNSFVRGPNFIPSGITGSNKGTNMISVLDARAVNFNVYDSTLAPVYPNSHTDAIQGHGFTAARNNIYDSVDGIDPLGTDVLIEANYIHDLSWFTVDSGHADGHSHNDCIQPGGGSSTIEYNNLEAFLSPTAGQGPARPYNYANSAILLSANAIPAEMNIIIANNWIDGGVVAINEGPGSYTNLGSISGNIFGDNQQYPLQMILLTSTRASAGLSISGNIYHAVDEPLTKPSRDGTTVDTGNGVSGG